MHVGTRITQNLTVLYSVALDGTEQRWIVGAQPGRRALPLPGHHRGGQHATRSRAPTASRSSSGTAAAAPAKAPREVERLASLRFEGTLPVPSPSCARRPSSSRAGATAGCSASRRRTACATGWRATGYRSASVEAISQPGRGRRRSRAARRRRPAGTVRLDRRRPRREAASAGRAGLQRLRRARGGRGPGRAGGAAAAAGERLLRCERRGRRERRRGRTWTWRSRWRAGRRAAAST